MRIGIIGAGHVGTTLGTSWANKGHTIVYSSRDPAAARASKGGTFVATSELAAHADVLVLATPWNQALAAVEQLGDCGNRPLIDATNPIGPGFTLAIGHTSSGAEQIAAAARSARVVKALNTTGVENMADPHYGEGRLLMPVAGDDRDAVATVAGLCEDLGFAPVALPALSRAREIEPLALLWIRLALQLGNGRDIGFGLARRAPGVHATPSTTSPQPIVIVGSGNIGGALARGWLRAGHQIYVAVRDAASAEASELASLGARIVPVTGAAALAPTIVLTVPAGAVSDVLAALGSVEGKVLVDCTNAIGKGFQLEVGHTSSSSEELARRAPGANVVRSFNQQGVEVLDNPLFGATAATNFVAGDDAASRTRVLELARDLGLDAVDAGPLASSRLLEPLTLLWIAMARALGTREIGLTLRRRQRS